MVWLPTPSFKHFICHDLMNSIASESKSWIFDMEMQYYYLGRSTFSSSSLAKCQIRYSNFESDTVSYLYMFDYRLSKLGMCYVFLQDDWLRKRELLMIQIRFFYSFILEVYVLWYDKSGAHHNLKLMTKYSHSNLYMYNLQIYTRSL